MQLSFLRLFLIAGITLIGLPGYTQLPTVGLLYWQSSSSEGYSMFSPQRNNHVYLTDNCGQKINEWTFSGLPAQTCYLLPNGNLLRAGQDSLEIRDWDNNLVWTYDKTAHGFSQHHDIHPLPNGNILCLVFDLYGPGQMIAQGRNPSLLNGWFWLDKIVELQPVGTHDALLVWEWKFIDHLIQDFDITKQNYGIVADHPELLDVNYNNNERNDFTHSNAIEYNDTLDQIMISSRNLNEIFIIDHSTTKTQAAGHTGGNSNRGGDFLWRWGNPRVYRQGGAQDQKLFLQHDPEWVPEGNADEGKISVFSNLGDGTGNFSSVHLLTPEFANWEYLMQDNKFLPLDFDWSWHGTIQGETLFEPTQSGVQSLPNGNVFICQTSLGQMSELTKDGTVLWVYKNPSAEQIYNQYDIMIEGNTIFRAEKYPGNYQGFDGKDMTPKGLIEDLNPVSDSCSMATGIETAGTTKVKVMNPVENGIIRFSREITVHAVVITDLSGRIVMKQAPFTGSSLRVDLKPSLYILQLYSETEIETRKILIR
jgi:hypothetical protein